MSRYNLRVQLTDVARQALQRAANAHGVTMADLVRQATAAQLGEPTIAEIRQPGRPAEKKSKSTTQ